MTFRDVSGECLVALGVCVANVLFGGEYLITEFLILPQCTTDVILGIDFLQDCGAFVNCGTGKITLNSALLSTLAKAFLPEENYFVVSNNLLIAPWSLSCVPVNVAAADLSSFDAQIQPLATECVKKKVLVPRSLVTVVNGASSLWAFSCSSVPAILPHDMKLV